VAGFLLKEETMKHFEFIMANVIWVVVALALQEPVTPPQAPPPAVSNRQLEAIMQKQKDEIERVSKDLTAKQCEAWRLHIIHGYPDALPVFNK
jgi:DNA-directed RNA polymerase specialized sigma24 family protein